MVKKCASGKINGTKMSSLFIHEVQLNTVLRLILSKAVIEFSIFDFVSLSLYFCSTERLDFLTLKRNNSFKN